MSRQTPQTLPATQLIHEKASLSHMVAVKPCSGVKLEGSAMGGKVDGSSDTQAYRTDAGTGGRGEGWRSASHPSRFAEDTD